MKTKMKRLLSLCLALVLALGAIPVSGFAAEPAKDAAAPVGDEVEVEVDI